MLRLSWSTFRERWQLFLGAILTVCLGVALVQSSLLILISAAGSGLVEAITLLGITLAVSTFLAVFIVSSTFAFTVAQRRRDLALLRLVGAGRKQVRRLLLSEALLLGVLGTAVGVPLGVVVMRLQTSMLTSLGFAPADFVPAWQNWILGVSAGVGIGVALAGVLAASRRAGKVRPLDALRDTGEGARVMTGARWFFGLLFLAGTIALVTVSSFTGPEAAIPLTINAALTASVALSALSPLVVPLVGGLLGLLLRGTTVGSLAQANLRDGVRRSASTAAPLLVLVALLVGQSGVLASINAAAELEQRRDLVGELVVTTEGPAARELGSVPGVAVAAERLRVPMDVTTRTDYDGDVDTQTDEYVATVVDPGTYAQTNRRAPELSGLRGETLAVAPGLFPAEAEIEVGVGGRTVPLRVVAELPESMGGGDQLLLPRGIVPEATAGAATAETIVRVRPGADVAAVAAEIRALGLGEVSTLDDWIAASASRQQDTSTGIMTVVLGLAGFYALIAVVNAVVIAAAERRREFAVARVSGLSRGQVVRMALVESWAVTVVGLLLGGLAAAGTLAGIGAATARVTGEASIVVPWDLLGITVVGALLVVGATNVWTTLAATRSRPVALVGAGE
ncbi:FtsX-like permease family protein [Prauserella cavernicola]|uniref:ABC transporter permease n=1 Tax=Prauserella cavernicola TaxID=2800127 RepID=A0A934QU49_9PSEU|nr:ABC transporter permease [Prauserella cavernicola]MBK1786545.1 ABC transporter permease [Prauserella cavernicola]